MRRRFGEAAGLLAALFLALTPISVAVDRSNNTESCLVLVLLLAACGNSAASPTPTPTPSRPGPAMVQIENSILARPLAGLQQANFVYEYLAEGGITRFIAVFLSGDAGVVGPVRSLRHYFAFMAADYGADRENDDDDGL